MIMKKWGIGLILALTSLSAQDAQNEEELPNLFEALEMLVKKASEDAPKSKVEARKTSVDPELDSRLDFDDEDEEDSDD